MSNDLWEIKRRILEEDKVEELMIAMGCKHIKPKSNRYEAQLPDKFDSSNPRAVQVYLNEKLSSRIRNMSYTDIDIYGLVSILVFDIRDEKKHSDNLFKAKKWICEILGYEITVGVTTQQKLDPLKWLKELKKKREKLRNFSENRIYPDTILNQFVMYPYLPYIEKGLNYQTQMDFQVGFDIKTERVIFPIYNQYGDIISIKGRTIDPNYKEKGIYKFLYLYNFNKMIELYNWHQALSHILEKKEIIIFEGEKTCWWATQFGFSNCVAIGGDDLSDYQVNMIKQLGVEIKIIIAMDKDKSAEDIKKQGNKFGLSRQVYALWDAHNLLDKEEKDSPTDKGLETFLSLYNEVYEYRIA